MDIQPEQPTTSGAGGGVLLGFLIGAVAGGVLGYFLGKKQGETVVVPPSEPPKETFYIFNEEGTPVPEVDFVEVDQEVLVGILDSREPQPKVDYTKPKSGIVIDLAAYEALGEDASPMPEYTGFIGKAPVRANVFSSVSTDIWDFEAEAATRTATRPYVIHEDEYIENENDYRQETVTYYAGDDMMADPLDTSIGDFREIMGELKFGHGTRSESIVYIRNEKLRLEWEVIHHTGHFKYEVLGVDYEDVGELHHSQHSVPKFRRD